MADQTQSSVSFTVPDFTDSDGVRYTEIEIVVQMNGDIRDAVRVVQALNSESPKRPHPNVKKSRRSRSAG